MLAFCCEVIRAATLDVNGEGACPGAYQEQVKRRDPGRSDLFNQKIGEATDEHARRVVSLEIAS